MRLKTTTVLLATAAAGGVFLVTGGATAASDPSATGGGQIIASTDSGAGDTIAFTARGVGNAATGQVQYVNRTGGTGQGETVQHGVVNCLDVSSDNGGHGVARISGDWNDGSGKFYIYVTDNGEGAASSDDVVVVSDTPSQSHEACDVAQPSPGQQTALGRGNAQVRQGS